MTDLRHLCYSCLSRGELKVPWFLLKHLSGTGGLNCTVIIKYVHGAIRHGRQIHHVLNDLKELVSLKTYPAVSPRSCVQISRGDW